MKKKWVSELIGTTYQDWMTGQMVFIRCHTGAGKSYFIVNILIKYALKWNKTVIIYVSRRTLFEKYQKDIVAFALQNGIDLSILKEHVKVYTYQSVVALISKGLEPEVADYTCMDEFHFFTCDGRFVAEADAIYHCFIRMLPKTIGIGISATGERAEEKFIKDRRLQQRYIYSEKGRRYHQSEMKKLEVWAYPNIYDAYELKADYSYLDIFYLDEKFSAADVVQRDCNNKWLIFVPSIKMGQEFSEQLLAANISVAFLCSENIGSEKETVQSITSMEKFSQQVLISTQVIDTGINLSDYQLKNVILISDVRESFIQLLGRKRLSDDLERVNLYIPKLSVGHFEKRLDVLNKKLDKFTEVVYGSIATTEQLMQYFKVNGFDTEITSMLYFCDGKMKISSTMLEEFEYQRNEYRKIIRKMSKDGDYFIKLQLQWLGLPQKSFDSSRYVSNAFREQAIKQFVEIVELEVEKGIKYSVEDGKNLVLDRLKEYAVIYDRDYADKSTFSVKSFNSFCQEYQLPYLCENKKGDNNMVQYRFLKTTMHESREE